MPLMRRTSMVRVSAVVLGGALLVAGGAGARSGGHKNRQ